MKLPEQQCASCPFSCTGLKLGKDKMFEIYQYLFEGTNHLCHSDRSGATICWGGRQWQLDVWSKMGIIEEPTNEALAIAMEKAGVEPKAHICT